LKERDIPVVPVPLEKNQSTLDWEELLIRQHSEVRLLFDENLPPGLKMHLADLFPGSVHVWDIDLGHSSDSSIWEYARAFNFAIMTKDGDFADRVRQDGPPPTVIHIRAGNCSTSKLVELIRCNATQITTAVQFGGPLLEVGMLQAIATSTE
jgi:predicted nuclease of predicted toxin-antitoxin system